MRRKDILKKRLARLNAKAQTITSRALASEDAKEVRSLNEELQDVNSEIAETEEELAAIEAEEAEEQRSASAIPAGAEHRNAEILGSFAQRSDIVERSDDPFDTMEYRMAFKAYVQTGQEIPAKFAQRDGAPAANTDTLGATIPTTVLNEFINEVKKVYGNLYRKVRKLNVPGAVKIPISNLQATFKWVNESTVSPRQDGGRIDDSVVFAYNTAELRVAQTLLSSIVTIDLFEREIVRVMTIAYLQAMDLGIVNGTGDGQMLGIVNDPRVTKVVEMSAADMNSWQAWRKKFFAQLPLGYRAGEFIFPIETVDAYLETMADANGNPIFRQATGLEVNDGDDANPSGRFFGRDVSLVEPDVIVDFDTANVGDVVGIYWQPDQYAINTNMVFGMRRYFDEEKNEWVNKMITIVDGKVLNPKGFVLIKKK